MNGKKSELHFWRLTTRLRLHNEEHFFRVVNRSILEILRFIILVVFPVDASLGNAKQTRTERNVMLQLQPSRCSLSETKRLAAVNWVYWRSTQLISRHFWIKKAYNELNQINSPNRVSGPETLRGFESHDKRTQHDWKFHNFRGEKFMLLACLTRNEWTRQWSI